MRSYLCIRMTEFQSTPSAWRVTAQFMEVQEIMSISIHTLRVEGDVIVEVDGNGLAVFQSTPSAWRVTGAVCAFV